MHASQLSMVLTMTRQTTSISLRTRIRRYEPRRSFGAYARDELRIGDGPVVFYKLGPLMLDSPVKVSESQPIVIGHARKARPSIKIQGIAKTQRQFTKLVGMTIRLI